MGVEPMSSNPQSEILPLNYGSHVENERVPLKGLSASRAHDDLVCILTLTRICAVSVAKQPGKPSARPGQGRCECSGGACCVTRVSGRAVVLLLS